MGFLTVAGVLFAGLFALMFFSRRRYGVMGLALAAGAMMSSLWVSDLTPLVAKAGVVSVQPPLESIVAAGLTLIPAALLLFSGPSYHKPASRMVGSVLFALLAILLLLDTLQSAVVIDGTGKVVFDALFQWKTMGVTFLLVAAVFDTWGVRTPKREKESKH